MIQNVRKVIEIQGIPLLPQRSEMVRATVPYFMRYFPVCILGPDLPGVWYRGRGHVWEECGRSMFMYGSSYARSSLCSLGVFLVTVCIEMN